MPKRVVLWYFSDCRKTQVHGKSTAHGVNQNNPNKRKETITIRRKYKLHASTGGECGKTSNRDKAQENIRAREARENMQPVKARENSSNPTKFVWQFCIGGTCHTSTATSKIEKLNETYLEVEV